MVKIQHYFQLLLILDLHKITFFGAKIQIIRVKLAIKNFSKIISFLLKNSISQFWIYLKIEFLDTIWDFEQCVKSSPFYRLLDWDM